jgi:hypothetical protein
MKNNNLTSQNELMKKVLIDLYSNIAPDGITEYDNVEKVTEDGLVILTGKYDGYYFVRDCWRGTSKVWSDWTNTIDNTGPVGEQHE